MQENKETAARATGQFRVAVAERRYSDIYAGADPEFQKTTSAAELSQFLGKIHEKLGSVTDVNEGSYHVNFTPSGTIVTLVYATKFERGEGTETFVWRLSSPDPPRLLGYNVVSKQLILN